jgi:hypothetical protein
VTSRVWTPPAPEVVVWTVVQALPSSLVWSWNALACAASQRRVTRQTVAVAPRSTRSHCGSEKALAQRVPVSPSTAAEAGVAAFSVDDAVAGRPAAAFVVPQAGSGVVVAPP